MNSTNHSNDAKASNRYNKDKILIETLLSSFNMEYNLIDNITYPIHAPGYSFPLGFSPVPALYQVYHETKYADVKSFRLIAFRYFSIDSSGQACRFSHENQCQHDNPAP